MDRQVTDRLQGGNRQNYIHKSEGTPSKYNLHTGVRAHDQCGNSGHRRFLQKPAIGFERDTEDVLILMGEWNSKIGKGEEPGMVGRYWLGKQK